LGLKTPLRTSPALVLCAAALLCALFCAQGLLRGEADPPAQSGREPISISATFAQSWQEGRETVHLLRGKCQIIQGLTTIRADRMVIWRRPDSQNSSRERVTAYLEEGRIDEPGNTSSDQVLLINLVTQAGVKFQATRPITGQTATSDPIYRAGLARRNQARKGTVRQAQYSPQEADAGVELRSVQLAPPPGGLRRLRFFSRSGGRFSFDTRRSEETTPPEQVFIFNGGINVLIDGFEQQPGVTTVGTIDLSADRAVVWTDAESMSNFTGGETVQAQEMPLQIYLEGNIVVRQGQNVLLASQAFYDVREERALLLDAEVRARIPGLPVKARISAQQLRQLAHNTFHAQQAFITTSDFFKPGYRLQASDIFVEPRFDDPLLAERGPVFDPVTGEQEADEGTLWATTLNNTFFVEDIPVLYLPYLSAPAEDPNIPLRNLQFHNDRIFGFQLRTTWDLFKLTGLDRPPGYRWDLNANYLSLRGPQFGPSASWRGFGRFGLDGPYFGSGYASFIYDDGHDNLGRDRLDLIPPHRQRGGALGRDQQDFPNGMTLYSEFGLVTDRNWLEQYREFEYDTGKDYETLVYLRQNLDDWSWSAIARPRLYNFYNESEWLPRGDLFGLAQPLAGGLFTWSSHSYVGYATQRIADRPTDPADLFTVLPFEGNANSFIVTTRHEIDMPFSLGPAHFIPYALGEESFWSQDFQGNSLNRLYGNVGMRGSIEFWRTFPEVRSEIFNLNGLAHKMVFDANYSFAESNQPITAVPIFNEFDDNSQEQFRRRLLVNTWEGILPPQFDPRSFAIRSGVGTGVAAPWNELVDNMNVLRLGWRQRLQTKAGPLNAPRIKNWMTLDLETALFPNYNRDNFGQLFGLYQARYNWYVGDRTTITSGALFDSFSGAEHLWNVGVLSQRTTRGSVYVGVRQIEGGAPLLHSEILTASYSYVMSPKWISSVSTAYDLGEHQNRGQTVQVTRVGADFLVHFGMLVDPTKNNFGLALSVEPRFAPFTGNNGPGSTQLGSLLQGTPGMGMGPAR
jgi:lipopolysaccharide export system protein LptA